MRPSPFLALLSVVLMAGCGSDGNSEYGQLLTLVRQGYKESFGNGGVTLKQAAAIPYASMGWRYNGSRENIIVLATDTNGQQIWTSAAHVVLQIQDGRIQRTLGLPLNLGGLTPATGPVLPVPALAVKGPYTDQRIADFPEMGEYGVRLTCHGHAIGRETIRILGKLMMALRVAEACSSPEWHFTNSYWIDPENEMVWRSIQHIHPGDAVLETEIFRPPG